MTLKSCSNFRTRTNRNASAQSLDAARMARHRVSLAQVFNGWCYKTFLEEIIISPKLFKKKICSDVWTSQKCENNAILKQSYTLKLFIVFNMVYSCCFSLGGNLDFPEILQNSFITSTTGVVYFSRLVNAVYKLATTYIMAKWKRYDKVKYLRSVWIIKTTDEIASFEDTNWL